jgi:hypothetical protein
MIVHANVMVKNESILLDKLLPIWKEYPIDRFIFYNDNSTDKTVDVIKKHLNKNSVILNDNRESFSESHNRSRMLEYSRENNADYVISIDCDELLSYNFVKNFDYVISQYEKADLQLYWYNVVNDSLYETRNDPLYKNNFRTFVLPMKYTGKFNLNLWKYHTPRTPEINLQKAKTKDVGIIHLQSINKRFYALKQLWYKHFEFINYKHTVHEINMKYDPVINNLEFNSIETPKQIVGDIKFDSSVYDDICIQKGYLDYIKKNYNKHLITFGEEYI